MKPSAKATPVAPTPKNPTQTSPSKPQPNDLLKAKSLTRIYEDHDIITNSEWLENSDFEFINAAQLPTPMSFARPKILDVPRYKDLSSAIKSIDYDPVTRVAEVVGEAGGLRMHSWVRVEEHFWDEIHFRIIRGDMTGFLIRVYLYEKQGKTLIIGKGLLPQAKRNFSPVVALAFKPLSEIVIGVATKNFRSYIDKEYQKQKR